jgi:hypothetical protein
MEKRTSAHQILKKMDLGIFKRVIPNTEIEDIRKRWYPEGRQRALTVGSLLGLLMAAQLERVRSVDELLQRGWGRVNRSYTLGHLHQPVSRQAFSKRLKTMPWQIYRDLLAVFFLAYSELVKPEQDLYQGIYTVQAIDGSVVDVAARLIRTWSGLPGRGGGPSRKAQAKIHTLFNVTMGIPSVIITTGAKRSERRQARKLVLEAVKCGFTILLTDLGYFEFAFFQRLMKAGVFFVARLKERTRCRRLKRLGRRDWLVRVGGWTPHQPTLTLRRVGVREGREIYWYLTNLLPEHGMTPNDIRVLYRKRWSIEHFFQAWKYGLQGKKFFCYNANGIKLQIYASLCAFILVRILVAHAALEYRFVPDAIGFQRAAAIVRTWIYTNAEQIWNLRPRQQVLDKLLCRIAAIVRCATSSQSPSKTPKIARLS